MASIFRIDILPDRIFPVHVPTKVLPAGHYQWSVEALDTLAPRAFQIADGAYARPSRPGGEFKPGQVVGASDQKGMIPKATGRPIMIVRYGKVIRELFARHGLRCGAV